MDKKLNVPLYARAALLSVVFFAFGYGMYLGQNIILPLVYAAILAILLNPLVDYLTRKKMNRVLAISISVVFATIIVLGIVYIIIVQLAVFSDTFPQFMTKFNLMFNDTMNWISEKFGIDKTVINNWLEETESHEMNHFSIGKQISRVGNAFVTIMLLPVYLIMILYYKPLFLEFIKKLFKAEHHNAIADILENSKNIIQSYLIGLFFEMIIIAILNSAGLLLIGLDYAILLGILGALLNVIPYLGGIIGVAIFMIVALVTKSPIYMMYVLGLYSAIQFLDNNYIIPRIVASRVQINSLVSVLVVLIGGAIWGVAGMFLSIPITAIVKVIFDHVDHLKPWGFLLGNTLPTTPKTVFFKKK